MDIRAHSRFDEFTHHNPQLDQEFQRGNFVVQISGRQFSQIHYHQAHKQSNKGIKSIKGLIDFMNCAIMNR